MIIGTVFGGYDDRFATELDLAGCRARHRRRTLIADCICRRAMCRFAEFFGLTRLLSPSHEKGRCSSNALFCWQNP